MPDSFERRHAMRIGLVGRPGAHTQDGLPVWVNDLSSTGARLAHIEPFHPGASLDLQLPPRLDSLRLVARVVWTTPHGREQTPEDEHHTLYQSGVAFEQMTPEQQGTLEGLVDRFCRERAAGVG